MMRNNLLTVTALTTILVGSQGSFANAPSLGEEIQSFGAQKVAHKIAPLLVQKFEDNILRGTPYVAVLPDGQEVRVIDRKTPVFTKLVEKVIDGLALPGAALFKGVTKIPGFNNYIEYKIKECLMDVTETAFHKVLKETDLLSTATSAVSLTKKAWGFATDLTAGDDAITAQYKQLTKIDQQMKDDIEGLSSQDERMSRYTSQYIDMLVRQTVRGYVVEGSKCLFDNLSQDALNVAKKKLENYAVKPVVYAGAGLGGAAGFGLGGGFGIAAGAAIGKFAGGIAGEKLLNHAVGVVNTKRQEVVENLAEIIALGVLPATDFELVRPDRSTKAENVNLNLENEWVKLTAYSDSKDSENEQSSLAENTVEIEHKVKVLSLDTLVSPIFEDWIDLAVEEAPSNATYFKVATKKAGTAVVNALGNVLTSFKKVAGWKSDDTLQPAKKSWKFW
jgi:hypothetical protein